MIGRLAYAEGSPCPTLVLDARYLPREDGPLLDALADARRFMAGAGAGHVLKIALVEPSSHPLFDLDYRFIQALPDGPAQFDLRGSCGHSILASIVSAGESGMLAKLVPGARVRVDVQNNGDQMVCEVDEVNREQVEFTVHFLHTPPKPVRDLLIVGEPRTDLLVDGERVEVSLVTAGNPYVFVDARTAGVDGTGELFSDDPVLFDRLSRIRAAAARRLGWPVDKAFPKVAAVMPTTQGHLAVRAISVPTWHPTIALTGAACLGAATAIEGTIPWLAARDAGCVQGLIDIDTAGGASAVTAATRDDGGARELAWITVARCRVTFYGSFLVEPLAHLQFKEIAECLSPSG